MKWLAGAIVLVLAAAAPARGEPDLASASLAYRVHQGDNLDLVSAEFYGDRGLELYIAVENKMKTLRPLHPGERIRIPVTREVVTQKGDSFESLAGTYLGDPRRAQFIAEFNQMSPEDSLATGTLITIPFHVIHTAATGESLAAIAQVYLGDPKQAELLKRYNFIDKPGIDKGESIAIPVLHARVRAGKLPQLDGDAKARRDRQKQTAADAARALPAARTAWLEGDFGGVTTTLGPLADKTDYLDTATAVEIGLLLGRAHVAFDDAPGATAAFTQVLTRKPRAELTVYGDSPKVLDAWRRAGGHVAGE